MFSRQPDRRYQGEPALCDRNVQIRICFVARWGWTNSWASIVCVYEKYSADNIKRQKHQSSVKNEMFISAKTVSSKIMPVVNRKGNGLYDIFDMKVASESLSVNILPVLKYVAFTWC